MPLFKAGIVNLRSAPPLRIYLLNYTKQKDSISRALKKKCIHSQILIYGQENKVPIQMCKKGKIL